MGKDVMVIEDDENMQKLLSLVLKEEGFSVRNCDSISCIKEEMFTSNKKPDIALIDVYLGFADGRKICEKIKKHLDIPVVLMSSDSSVNSSAYEAGADYFMPKPLEIDQLTLTLNRCS